jgi:RNA polymerase sigma-70 factor (ECF subfamily)
MVPSEPELFARAERGDTAALEQLLEHYLPQLHAFVRARLGRVRARETSLDVVQSLCRELLANRREVAFTDEDRFRGWLFTAALNKILAKKRFHGVGKRDLAREQDPDTEALPKELALLLTPSVDAIGNETAAALEDALAALSAEHREVITLARIVRLPHDAIAEMMGRSTDATRQLLARALLRLRAELHARGVELE